MTSYEHKGVPRFASETQGLTKGPEQPALYANLSLHPTQKMQERCLVDGERKKLQEMSVLYGSHMAMRRVIEGSMLS